MPSQVAAWRPCRSPSCRPSDTTRWVAALYSVSQVAFDEPAPPAGPEHARSLHQMRGRAALSLLRGVGTEVRLARWHYWVLGVESTGRVTLPAEARKAIGVPSETSVAASCRGTTLVLRPGASISLALAYVARMNG